MNHFAVHNKMQLLHALLAGAYPTFEEAKANPFTIELVGTNFRMSFPEGLHERKAEKSAAQMRRKSPLFFRGNP